MNLNIQQAINYLEAHGFLVKGYGFPENESYGAGQGFADSYRVIQGDYDTGMIAPHQLVEVVDQMKGR